MKVIDGLIKKGIKVDAIITDPPYGTTACKWDSVIPFEDMWDKLHEIKKGRTTPVILFSSQPFTSQLITSNLNMFKYNLIWEKEQGTDFMMAKKKPLKNFEEICVFYEKQCVYNPQMIQAEREWKKKDTGNTYNEVLGQQEKPYFKKSNGKLRYPTSILRYSRPKQKGVHPTQKPIELMEWLINTYTNENDLILDFTCGSGTTLIAAKKLGRKAIGIELDEKYCEITKDRILRMAI